MSFSHMETARDKLIPIDARMIRPTSMLKPLLFK